MKKQFRTMKENEVYIIEEKIGDGTWTSVCRCYSINEAKELLRNLKNLESDKNEE